ncbi:hypothetical protein C8034_v004491 [Colletotrichum sidae]|uniref:Uncharacterized protein n=2 Tax=Colletotrichum orbiculare species complex TaxID=2707354 RepID=A0A4V6QE84_9PEZI|nr:hypothetical protein C8035_v000255 [Colletotrichum spinosum]TEA13643.1 hypothetical protein C8034_v004491 [Colletotrichum sidae]
MEQSTFFGHWPGHHDEVAHCLVPLSSSSSAPQSSIQQTAAGTRWNSPKRPQDPQALDCPDLRLP